MSFSEFELKSSNVQNQHINPDSTSEYFCETESEKIPDKKTNFQLYSCYIENFRKSHYETIPLEFYEKIKYSLDRINDAFNHNTKFDKENIFISFNGGKDCLAAYILIKFYLYCGENNLDYSDISSFLNFISNNMPIKSRKKINLVYFLNKKNFDCEEDYVVNLSKKEDINIYYIYADYVLGLNFLIEKFNLKSIFMGTRADDMKINHHQNENLIHESTAPYPNFFRFYPVYKFDFEDIWRLILITKFDYMKLYDNGFSSIGNKFNTKINENLIFKINGEKIDELILPAWCLKEMVSERSFRDTEKIVNLENKEKN